MYIHNKRVVFFRYGYINSQLLPAFKLGLMTQERFTVMLSSLFLDVIVMTEEKLTLILLLTFKVNSMAFDGNDLITFVRKRLIQHDMLTSVIS